MEKTKDVKPYCSEEKDNNSYHKGREEKNFYHNDRGGHNSYHNDLYKRDEGRYEKRPFRGTCFKCGGRHRAFKCHQGSTSKRIENTRRTTYVDEEPIVSHNSNVKTNKCE